MKSIRPSGFYIIRKPSRPINIILDFFDQTQNTCCEVALKSIFEEKYLQEAMYVTSQSLFHEFQGWIRNNNPVKKDRLKSTLLKYLIRTSSRATPFGMFSGCLSIGRFSSSTEIHFNNYEPYTKYRRLNVECLCRMSRSIISLPNIKYQIKFYPNNSLYRIANKYRYTYCLESQPRNYSVCSVERSTYLEKVIEEAKGGKTILQIIESLISEEVSEETANDFILELIDEQILVSELEIRLTGKDFFCILIERLSTLSNTVALVDKLSKIQSLLKEQEDEIAIQEEIKKIVNENFAGVNNNILHTDLIFNATTNTISSKVINSLSKTFEELTVLNQVGFNSDLEQFKKKFHLRYGEQEVPLLLALDNDAGVGYGDPVNNECGSLPLIDSLSVNEQNGYPTIEWNNWKNFILKKYTDALYQNQFEIVLSEQDLKTLEVKGQKEDNNPGSFAAFGTLLAESQKDLDNGNFKFNLSFITGPSGANIIARFCNEQNELQDLVKEHLHAEEREFPHAVFAEIVHLPEDIAGNILIRPGFRKYEIPFLAASSVENQNQISLDDLMISVKNGKEIILRSIRLNKRIIPRLTTTHNFNKSVGIYKFLCDLQFDKHSLLLKWHWSILEKQTFLPRVSYRNVILSRATWTFMLEDFPGIKDKSNEIEHFIEVLNVRFHIPRYILICDNDNELLIDIQNTHCKALLREEFIKKGILILKEFLQTPANCFIYDQYGKYTNEIVIPFEKNDNSINSQILSFANLNKVKRQFSVGSEWLYFKIYTGEKIADDIIKSALKPLTEELLNTGIIDKYFFCRYTDPENHLRIRFHGDCQKGFYKESMQYIYSCLDELLQQGLINRIQFDTYDREIERYGNDTIELSEELFHYDSIAVLDLLGLLRDDNEEKYRWIFAIKGVDSLLDDFDYSLAKKVNLIERLYENYLVEFKNRITLKRQLDDKYRNNAPEIEAFLNPEPSINTFKNYLTAILKSRSEKNYKISGRIKALTLINERNLDALISSYLHMFLNRLFLSKPRLHEYVIYHHLHKYYRSIIAQAKNKKVSTTLEKVLV